MPIEALHSLEGGLMKESLNILYDVYLKPHGCKILDNFVKK